MGPAPPPSRLQRARVFVASRGAVGGGAGLPSIQSKGGWPAWPAQEAWPMCGRAPPSQVAAQGGPRRPSPPTRLHPCPAPVLPRTQLFAGHAVPPSAEQRALQGGGAVGGFGHGAAAGMEQGGVDGRGVNSAGARCTCSPSTTKEPPSGCLETCAQPSRPSSFLGRRVPHR